MLLACCVRDVGQPPAALAIVEQSPQAMEQQAAPVPSDAASHDPRELLEAAQEKYADQVQAYQCTFWRQERIAGRLTKQQKIEVLFQESPRTVLMRWVRNIGRVKRALYSPGKNINQDGEECVLVEPSGAFARLCFSKVPIPIHGRRARAGSRFPIDAFGFGATLERIQRVNAMAAQRGELTLRYAGVGRVDGRPTHIIERTLPETGRKGPYPDARTIVQLDQEWLVPVSVESYADPQGQTLLGSYLTTNIKFHRKIDDELLRF